jgi:hypothetical protein
MGNKKSAHKERKMEEMMEEMCHCLSSNVYQMMCHMVNKMCMHMSFLMETQTHRLSQGMMSGQYPMGMMPGSMGHGKAMQPEQMGYGIPVMSGYSGCEMPVLPMHMHYEMPCEQPVIPYPTFPPCPTMLPTTILPTVIPPTLPPTLHPTLPPTLHPTLPPMPTATLPIIIVPPTTVSPVIPTMPTFG